MAFNYPITVIIWQEVLFSSLEKQPYANYSYSHLRKALFSCVGEGFILGSTSFDFVIVAGLCTSIMTTGLEAVITIVTTDIRVGFQLG